MSGYVVEFLAETADIAGRIDASEIDRAVDLIATAKFENGRLFVIGLGGGAGYASHAAADFRNLAGVDAISLCDNVSALTATMNDSGWGNAFSTQLRRYQANALDVLLVFSVGGGTSEVSLPISNAVKFARACGLSIIGVTAQKAGNTQVYADTCIVIPAPPERLTAHVEAFQAVVWHLMVTHPSLLERLPLWESLG